MPIFQAAGAMHHFVHVPKCGGQSVEAYLAARFGPLAFLEPRYYKTPAAQRWSKSSPQHIEAEAFTKLMPDDWIASQFAIVRHPLARFASSYNFYLANLNRIPRLMGPEEWFAEYRGFAKRRPHYLDNHLRPQTQMVPQDCAVFKLEDGMAPVVTHIDSIAGEVTGPREIGHGHVTKDAAGMKKSAMSAQLLRKLRTYYAEDFERFGYDAKEDVRADVYVVQKETLKTPERLRLQRKRLQRRIWGAGLRLTRRAPD